MKNCNICNHQDIDDLSEKIKRLYACEKCSRLPLVRDSILDDLTQKYGKEAVIKALQEVLSNWIIRFYEKQHSDAF